MPPGFPIVQNEDALRRLPNLEEARARIIRREDAPDPAGWSALPMHSALHANRALATMDTSALTSEQLIENDAFLLRAHPQWVIETPPARAPMLLENLTPAGRLATALPALRVVFDYINGDQTATRDLAPQLLVLYPEEGKMTVTYRKPFTLPRTAGAERGLRLRTETGWFQPPASENR